MKNKNFLEFMAQKNVPVAIDGGTEQRDPGKSEDTKAGELFKSLKEILELAKNAVDRFEKTEPVKDSGTPAYGLSNQPTSGDKATDMFGKD